jgi:hypothetical protein
VIYRSNLMCPDLQPYFKNLVSRPMAHSFGHDVPSDWGDKADDDPVFGLYKRCGFWTHDEAAILYHAVVGTRGTWVDIGAHTGWTTAHMAAGSRGVTAVDPILRIAAFQERFESNTKHCWNKIGDIFHCTSNEFFGDFFGGVASGFCIDGDHEPGKPLEDAQGAAEHLGGRDGVIIFHDFLGEPVQQAVTWLMNRGFHARIYLTPHMVACCWRGNFSPPYHESDPNLPDLKARCPTFDWSKDE